MHTKNSTDIQVVVRAPHESTTIIVTTPSWECTEIKCIGTPDSSCNKSDSRFSRIEKGDAKKLVTVRRGSELGRDG